MTHIPNVYDDDCDEPDSYGRPRGDGGFQIVITACDKCGRLALVPAKHLDADAPPIGNDPMSQCAAVYQGACETEPSVCDGDMCFGGYVALSEFPIEGVVVL